MKKLSKKELEVVVERIENEIKKVKKEKLVKLFEESEEGKRMRKLEEELKEELEEVNKKVEELRELGNSFLDREFGERRYGLVDVERVDSFRGFSVGVVVGKYGVYNKGRGEIEKEIILEGLKGEFDLEELMKGMVEKFG